MSLKLDTVLAGAAVVALVAVGVWIWRRGIGGAAADAASGAVQVAGGAAVGAVKGTAAVVGIPDTNKTECEKALAEGRYWDASFLCPAGTFIGAGANAIANAINNDTSNNP